MVFTPTDAEHILKDYFLIDASAKVLAGEVDFNFKMITDSDQDYLLKLSSNEVDLDFIQFQHDLLSYLNQNTSDLIVPKTYKDKNGGVITKFKLDDGRQGIARLLSWVPGRIYSSVNPQLPDLRNSLGKRCGQISNALVNFDHPLLHREFQWDVAQGLWTESYIHLFANEDAYLIQSIIDQFKGFQHSYVNLRKGCIHNDANDNNIVVTDSLESPEVVTIIDYGDAINSQYINDVAVACAYAIMDKNDPLEAALPIIEGYHSEFPLQEIELEHLYLAIAMRLVISVTKSAINKIEEPDNDYLLISEKPAWDLLRKWEQISSDFALYTFRHTCGYIAHPDLDKFTSWAKGQSFDVSEMFPTGPGNGLHHLDLSVSSLWMGHEFEFNDLDLFQYKIDKLQSTVPEKVIAGGYLEPRPIYTSSSYDKIGNSGRESRTIHLGVDFWLPAGTPVHALFDGEVVTAVDDAGFKEYGGLVILKHQIDDLEFFTLYGHNTVESALKHNIGDKISKGDKIAELGDSPENGHWAPHLHFQIMLSMLDYTIDFPGVGYFNQIGIWQDLCPDPNLLFKSEALKPQIHLTDKALINYRAEHLGKGLSLQYDIPIRIVRGAGPYLMDHMGRKYLDTVNNVAHVGHEHPEVVKAGQRQMSLLNTNTRYLHPNLIEVTKSLLETFPPELCVVHFVNSGSEANELAIRMAKTVTGSKDVIASEVGYHGNTNTCVDISSYKFDGKSGKGAPDTTHIFPIPDTFRGKYTSENAAEFYANDVLNCIKKIHDKERNVAAFIIEPILSCGGQIELPDGFLKLAYEHVRNANGLCISDEVQTGCGRVGKTFWGFQLHDVIPDIVTIGKPLGNGHPVAAVVCTEEVATKFANGMEYFNTFGGNPVSCAIAKSVLDVVKNENLQNNANETGDYLKSELNKLSEKFPIIGDVRGLGLFLGIELVDSEKKPLPRLCSYVVNRMKEHGILMSIDGPDHNVIKIKPPLVFNQTHAKEVLFYLEKVLAEDLMIKSH